MNCNEHREYDEDDEVVELWSLEDEDEAASAASTKFSAQKNASENITVHQERRNCTRFQRLVIVT